MGCSNSVSAPVEMDRCSPVLPAVRRASHVPRHTAALPATKRSTDSLIGALGRAERLGCSVNASLGTPRARTSSVDCFLVWRLLSASHTHVLRTNPVPADSRDHLRSQGVISTSAGTIAGHGARGGA